MDRKILIDLLNEENYPAHMIENTINKLENLQPVISLAFTDWVFDGLFPSIVIEGYSYTILTNEYGMKPIGAFLTLDWLTRDPDKAVKALKRGFR